MPAAGRLDRRRGRMRGALHRAGETDRTEVAAKQVRAGVHADQAARVADRGDVQFEAVVIDMHEHDVDVPRELGGLGRDTGPGA